MADTLEKQKTVTLELVAGFGEPGLYLNEYRISGGKAAGGTIWKKTVRVEDILTALGPLAPDQSATAEVEELRAEVARLRNIMNEDGLHDPELAEMAGKPIGVIEASVKATKGEGITHDHQ